MFETFYVRAMAYRVHARQCDPTFANVQVLTLPDHVIGSPDARLRALAYMLDALDQDRAQRARS